MIGGGSAMAAYDEPKYRVIEASEPFEVREYAEMIVAEIQVTGNRKEAVNSGFRILADYIFGGNVPGEKIAMTAPVTQQGKGEKIPMTAPVTQQGEGGVWNVRFFMPDRYTLESLPRPNNPKIRLNSIPSRRMVAIRFSGFWSDKNMMKNLSKLRSHVREKGFETVGEPVFAVYNPPWTLPFLRRNEVLLEIKSESDQGRTGG
jgi:hypothetical protein